MNWSGRVAIVTGASSGIGRACSLALAARGVRIALVARSRDKLDTLARSLGSDNAASFPLDVTDRAALSALPSRARRTGAGSISW
jgi:NADP-dependent 3-hydroxy acid dehydrogenase YdfG